MLAIARRNIIKEQLRERKSVTITDLADRLNVTRETIRRDLRIMEESGELIRTHGGAYIIEGVQNDLDVTTRQVLKTDEKKVIAQKCSALILPGDFIYLDGSTTAWFIAKQILDRKLTVLTTSLEIANILSKSSTVRLFLIGGEFARNNMSFAGEGAIQCLQRYFVDKAFISCRSVSMEFGLTDTSENGAMLHRVALEHAKQKYLVADHSKIDNTSFASVCPVSALDGIVTDMELDQNWKNFLWKNGVAYY